MTRFRPGDVVLLRFPFTDMETRKRRPALVVNPIGFSTRYGDVVVPLTGRAQDEEMRLGKWKEAGLLKPTWLKPLIATVAGSLVEGSLGVLSAEDEGKVESVMRILIAPKFTGGVKTVK